MMEKNGAAALYGEMKPLLKNMSKKTYERNMELFLDRYGDYLRGLTAADAAAFARDVRAAFEKRGRVSGIVQADLNVFTVYYVFPAILKRCGAEGPAVCGSLEAAWEETFPGNKIRHADYETIHGSFKEKLFGFL